MISRIFLVAVIALTACAGARTRDNAVTVMETATALPTVPPEFRTKEQIHLREMQGILLADVRVTPLPDGRVPFFRASDVGQKNIPRLTPRMVATLGLAKARIRKSYHEYLTFAFEPWYDQQYFVLFLNGFPRYPAINLCHHEPGCDHECPIYVNPITHQVQTATINRCADRFPIWVRG